MDHINSQQSVSEIIVSSKHSKGLSGINNRGNTCYVNSAIQALSHNKSLTKYLFENETEIKRLLIRNARKILGKKPDFQIPVPPAADKSVIPIVLREKIADTTYDLNTLSDEEKQIIYNNTITFQLRRMLAYMWNENCKICPLSFLTIFSEVRDEFFGDREQHDSQEAFSCIIDQAQEELSIGCEVSFKTKKKSVIEYLRKKDAFKKYFERQSEINPSVIQQYNIFKREMSSERIIVKAYVQMRNYYSNNCTRITDIFSGFLHSRTSCPNADCGYSSHRFDAFMLLSLSIPSVRELYSNLSDHLKANPQLTQPERAKLYSSTTNKCSLYDCFDNYCKSEQLDVDNLWNCNGCKNKVRAIKNLQIWQHPQFLTVQLKRFGEVAIAKIKDQRLVDYPLDNLDISKYISPENIDSTKNYLYNCYAVINHTGNFNSGHYFSYCKDFTTGNWHEFNDRLVTPCDINKVVNSNAYILCYMRSDMII